MLPADIRLEPHLHKVTAANGTSIEIIGKNKFQVKLNGVPFVGEMLVSYDVDEAMLGIDFLTTHQSCWHLNHGTIVIDSHKLQLHAERNRHVCRRIYCRNTSVIPAQTQQDIHVQMPLKNFNDGSENMLIDIAQLRPGVIMASAVLPGDETVTMVRVYNTSTRDVTLDAGTSLTVAYSSTV
jgi:hypothetical protein